MNIDQIILIFSLLIGATVGSFLNVVILRLPLKDASIVYPASHCTSCNTPLRWYENIPILSYLFLRGRCGHCKTSISKQNPIVETLMALLTFAVVQRFGLSITAAGYFFFCGALITIIWIDIHHQIIPNDISFPGIVGGFLFSFFNTQVSWQSSLFGILAGGGILYGISSLYFLLRKQEGLGQGDVKLLAMIGAFLGWQSLLFVIFFSSVTGTIIGLGAMAKQGKGGSTRIPFGPFLSLAAIIYLFFNQEILYYFALYQRGELF